MPKIIEGDRVYITTRKENIRKVAHVIAVGKELAIVHDGLEEICFQISALQRIPDFRPYEPIITGEGNLRFFKSFDTTGTEVYVFDHPFGSAPVSVWSNFRALTESERLAMLETLGETNTANGEVYND